ncbi:MAG: hypothetical protein ABIJ34_04225 [archaeon]
MNKSLFYIIIAVIALLTFSGCSNNNYTGNVVRETATRPSLLSCDNIVCSDDKVCNLGACVCKDGFHECNGDCFPKTTCCMDSDCADTEKCDNGECIDACKNVVCTIKNSVCLKGDCVCKDGFFKSQNGDCIKQGTCNSDSDCTNVESCKQGVCVKDCSKISNLDDKSKCYIDLAVVNKDVEICKRAHVKYWDQCLTYVALVLNDYDICESLTNGRDGCIQQIAINTEDRDGCDKITELGPPDHELTTGISHTSCIISVATKLKDPTVCKGFALKQHREWCVGATYQFFSDISQCDNWNNIWSHSIFMKPKPNMPLDTYPSQDACYLTIARLEKDIDICNKIENQELINVCYDELYLEPEIKEKNPSVAKSLNNPPQITLGSLEVIEGDLFKLDFHIDDKDDDPIEVTFSEPLNSNGRWQTNLGDEGTYVSSITVSDGKDNVTEYFVIKVLKNPYSKSIALLCDKPITLGSKTLNLIIVQDNICQIEIDGHLVYLKEGQKNNLDDEDYFGVVDAFNCYCKINVVHFPD